MTFFQAVGLAGLRSLLLTVLCLPLCALAAVEVRRAIWSGRWGTWLLILGPYLFPELLVGYAYGQFSRLSLTSPVIRELWFDWLLLWRIWPVGTLLLAVLPPGPDFRMAWHCRRLSLSSAVPFWYRWGSALRLWSVTSARAWWPTGVLLFLLVFQEFELPSLLAIPTWTVWLFDSQMRGLPWHISLRYSLIPAAIAGGLSWRVWSWHAEQPLSFSNRANQGETKNRLRTICWWGMVACTWGWLILWPLWNLGGGLLQGLPALIRNRPQWHNTCKIITFALAYGLLGGLLADRLAVWQQRSRGVLRYLLNACAGLGLCGVLPVSLFCLALFQLPGLKLLYDTPLLVIVGLALWVWPRVWVLDLLRQWMLPRVTVHLATLLRAGGTPRQSQQGSHLCWVLSESSEWWSRVLICYWAYWDLTAASILGAPGLESAPVRLYIDMHFGRNAVLTTKALLTMLVPAALLLLGWLWFRRRRE